MKSDHFKEYAQGLLDQQFFQRDVLEVAPDLLGKFLVINRGNQACSYQILEVEAYRGEEDKACHASKGRTTRTEIMYQNGGHIYVYLIYGMYWMLNIVTGTIDIPQAVLIRGIEGFSGPGRLSKHLEIDRTFYGENICNSNRIRIIDKGIKVRIETSPRVGINYSGEPWTNMLWRYTLKPEN
jgi:DNA-3-methyladenine glycosylase